MRSTSTWSPRERISREQALWWLAIFVLLGIALRLDLLFASHFAIDADEAIVGLMAMHISQGGPWPVFYYGQHYMGSLEPLLVAAVFRIVGPSNAALIAVPFCFAIALIPLTYRLARQICGRRGALCAALFMAVPPTALVVWSTKPRGGFIELVFLGALALFLTCRWLRTDRDSLTHTAIIGVVLGIGWWTNNQIIFFMMPIGFVMLAALLWQDGPLSVRIGHILAHAATGILSFIFGGAPFWWYNLSRDFPSFAMFTPASSTGVGEHVQGLFSTAIPILLGAKRFWNRDDIFPGASLIAYTLLALLVIGYLVIRVRSICSLAVCRVNRPEPAELFSLFVLGSLCTFVLSSFGWLYEAPRYLLPVYVGLFVLFGYVLERWYLYARWFATFVAAIIVMLNLASGYWGGRAIPGEPLVFAGERVQRDHGALLTWLDSQNVQWIRTNYWIGYRVAFETLEKVKFLTYHEPQYERIPEYRSEAALIPTVSMPLVVVPAQAALITRALKVMGYHYSEQIRSGYTIIFDVNPGETNLDEIGVDQLEAQASQALRAPALAIDDDLTSRWGTGEPQKPGQEFVLRLKTPSEIRSLAFDLGAWPHDFPRGLRIELELNDGTKSVLLSEEDWEAVRYYNERDTRFQFFFGSREVTTVRFMQMGSDPIFDWSFAEVELYR